MISFVRGPGGLLRRLAAEFVPLCLAVTAAWLGYALVSPLVAAAAGVVVWLLFSFLLRAVRRRPLFCTIYRLALVGHVVFWSAQGIEQTRVERPGSVGTSHASAWPRPGGFRAGYGAADFALPERTTLGGWGSRPRRRTLPAFGGFGVVGCWCQACMAQRGADGTHRSPMFVRPDPDTPAQALGARALVLRPEGDGGPVAIVRLDLVTSDARLAAAIAADVADLGFRPEGLLVAATHTHSGPGGYSRSPLSAMLGTDHFDEGVFRAIVRGAVAAVRSAYETAEPARIALTAARDDGEKRLARLRGEQPAGAELDDRVYALRVWSRDEASRPIAVLLQYAVHPTLLRRRHLAFSRDIAGALEEELSAALAGNPPVLFVNGAVGDVGAENRYGTGAEAARQLAAEFAAAVGPDLEIDPRQRASDRLGVAAVRRHIELPDARLVTGLGDRERVIGAVTGGWGTGSVGEKIADAVALPVNALVWSFTLPEVRVGFSWSGALGAGVTVDGHDDQDEVGFGAWELAFDEKPGGRGSMKSGCSLVWLPGEATTPVGRRWRAALAEPARPDVLVVGLTNGSVAYLTSEAQYLRGGYEAVATIYGPALGRLADEALREAADEARRLVGR